MTILPEPSPAATLPVLLLNPRAVEGLRGRQCWNPIFVVIAILASAFFGFKVSAYSTQDPLERGMGAFAGIFSCFAVFRGTHAALASRSDNFLSQELSIQFFFRGAVVSIILAMILELVELRSLRPRNVELKDLPIALIVGFSEEISKFFVVVMGVSLLPWNLPQHMIDTHSGVIFRCIPSSCFARMWTVLIESPRAFAMAGIAAGFGFMTTENLEYFFQVFVQLDITSCIATSVMRIALNLHPLLTGLAAARLAQQVWSNGATAAPRTISIGKVAVAMYPSIVIHAMYDFGLMFATSNPGEQELDIVFVLISLLLIPTSYYMLVRTYRSLPA